MKRSNIEPGMVVSKVSYRDQRQGSPVLILSTDSYQRHWREGTLTNAGRERLISGDYRNSAVGLLAVDLTFNMHAGTGDEGDGPPLDVLEFRARVEQVRELVSVPAAIAAIEQRAREGFLSEHNPLVVRDAEGTVVGSYELLTSLQMVQGEYVPLTLAERQRAAQSTRYAHEHEQRRVRDVARFNELAGRLDNLGITGYHAASYESPSRFAAMSFEDTERLVELAEAGHAHEITTQDMMS